MALRWRRCLPCLKHINWLTLNSCRCVSLSAPVYDTLYNSFKENRFTTCDITSSEVLRALRPFYLAVHPDLFSQYPQERNTNEDSLKKLNSYLDALESGCGQDNVLSSASLRPKPIQLTFFIRGGQSENLKAISIALDAYSIGSAVHDILQSCDLFADINNPMISKLLRTKYQENEKHRVLSTYKRYKSHHHGNQEPLQDYPDFDYVFSERNRAGSEHVQQKQPEFLKKWLKRNLPLAKSRLDSSKCLREENESLRENICSRHRLQRIKVNPDWTAATVKGHLLSLERGLGLADVAALVERSPAGGGLSVVLGHSGSFVSVHGEVHLSCEDTLQQWLQYLLSQAMKELATMREIDSLEKELLDLMNHGDKLDTRLTLKRPSTVTPSKYHMQLKEYISLCRHQPLAHNLLAAIADNYNLESNADDVITIVTKSQAGLGEPFLLEDGTVEVPVNYSLSTLGEFWSQNLHKIRETRRNHKRSVDEMLQAVQTCKQKLLLNDLTIKASIKNDQIKSSCQRLLQLGHAGQGEAEKSSEDLLDLKGHYLSLTNSYSVSSDGELRIPWDFKITFS